MLYPAFALKLHAFGLSRLQDAEWCGTELYERAKRHYRGRAEPKWLFQKILPNGFLFYLGQWLFEEYWNFEIQLPTMNLEKSIEYVEDYLQMRTLGGLTDESAVTSKLSDAVESANSLYDENKNEFHNAEKKIRRQLRLALVRNSDRLSSSHSQLAPKYAANYADRVFHDRELCGYIAQLILEIGIDGTTEDENPRQWCNRTKFPTWAKSAVDARDRGKCSKCKKDLVAELQGTGHVDHIVPLSRGGCNDLVNLQLFCSSCNSKKRAGRWPSCSSIPPYISRKLKM